MLTVTCIGMKPFHFSIYAVAFAHYSENKKAPPKRSLKFAALPFYGEGGLRPVALLAALTTLAGLLSLLAGILLTAALLAALAGLVVMVLLARIAVAAALLALIAHRAFLLVILGHRKFPVVIKLAQGNR